jgi:hypothetical protein
MARRHRACEKWRIAAVFGILLAMLHVEHLGRFLNLTFC